MVVVTNGAPFQLARGGDMTYPDWDVAYICPSDPLLPYYECEPARHACTASGFAAAVATLEKRVHAAFLDNGINKFGVGHFSVKRSKAFPNAI